MAAYLEQLDVHDQVEADIIRPMLGWLALGSPMRVLDAGCGEGGVTLMLAESGAHVTALDHDPARLQVAAQRLAETPFAAQVTLEPGGLSALPFADDSFDLVWCSRVLHHIGDKLHVTRELCRVLRPGGRLAILEGGLSMQLLPFDLGLGEPGLQDRLRVADNRWFAAMTAATLADAPPYPFGWSQLLIDAGLIAITARTFTLDALSPLSAPQAALAP